CSLILRHPLRSTLFPYTTLFRSYTIKNVLTGVTLALLALSLAYGFAPRLPLSVQRAFSFLPAINIDSVAREDGDGTMEMRRILRDRKSTRLNSSHDQISYAVFCL